MLLLLYTYWTPLLTLELYLVALPWLAWMCVCFEVPSYLGWCLTLAYIPGTLPWCHPSQWCLTLGPCISSPGGVKASEPAFWQRTVNHHHRLQRYLGILYQYIR